MKDFPEGKCIPFFSVASYMFFSDHPRTNSKEENKKIFG